MDILSLPTLPAAVPLKTAFEVLEASHRSAGVTRIGEQIYLFDARSLIFGADLGGQTLRDLPDTLANRSDTRFQPLPRLQTTPEPQALDALRWDLDAPVGQWLRNANLPAPDLEALGRSLSLENLGEAHCKVEPPSPTGHAQILNSLEVIDTEITFLGFGAENAFLLTNSENLGQPYVQAPQRCQCTDPSPEEFPHRFSRRPTGGKCPNDGSKILCI